ncbi:MAG: hypothetical protein V4670_01255 [Bacteroidota bacterium]
MKTRIFKTVLLFVLISFSAMASSNPVYSDSTQTSSTTKMEGARAQVLLNRLEEIKSMDKSDLTRVEKKALRKEVKEIKTTLKTSNGGVYLSVGAIIIVVLLLILIL